MCVYMYKTEYRIWTRRPAPTENGIQGCESYSRLRDLHAAGLACVCNMER